MIKIAVTLAVALIAIRVPSALSEPITPIDRFQLWNDCQPVRLSVADVLPDATAIGLTKRGVEATVRGRLRVARLYADDATAYLYVNGYVHKDAFAVIVRFRKQVIDPASQSTSHATTWHNESAGLLGDAGFVLSSVALHTDRFIDEYLRVNADAC